MDGSCAVASGVLTREASRALACGPSRMRALLGRGAGPLVAARLSAVRLGWDFRGPFRLRRSDGAMIVPTLTSPKQLAERCREAWQKVTEQDFARTRRTQGYSWHDHEPSPEPAPGGPPLPALAAAPSALILRRVMRSKDLSALERGSLAAVAVGATWTRQRLFDAGMAAALTWKICRCVCLPRQVSWTAFDPTPPSGRLGGV